MLTVLWFVKGFWAEESHFALSLKKKGYKNKMKTKTLTVVCCLLLAVILFTACSEKTPVEGRWTDATYLENTELGSGEKTVTVKVVVESREVVFTIHSDAVYLGDALLEHKLIEGEEGQYGLYVKRVNGMLADYDIDKTYWGFYKNGEMVMSGVSLTEFSDGEQYELVLES